ncbi:ribonucleoside-diphosphate reductase subunit alpha [Medusavirus stheno T3]|uniref:Ribonucleoside-diphosphate reductase n=1 Tax=Medusavirus stheno T3 TaxID=3069717 RepID=A0A7S7YFA0_9VIRU|nr:ribonucleoside-diphosphate reductase subunit alpha [Acanthamoeba castellanii medusavirus]QPB44445.1 ribonucleoside-diphosphate reductase subunit alpha [Medusavirus stheno T3]
MRGTYVIKRDGQPEPVSFDKITKRLRCLCDMQPALSDAVDPILVTQKVVQGVYNGVHTSQLDDLAAETAVFMSTLEPDYAKLAGRIVVSNLHKDTDGSVLAVFRVLHAYIEPRTGLPAPLVSGGALAVVEKHHDALQEMINYERDYQYSFFGYKTLERSYLLKVDGKIVERPQNMILRVAVGLHGENLERVRETYELMSSLDFTHATPTLFNSATPKPQLSSCFVAGTPVFTTRGVVAIEDVKIGDHVITHTGAAKAVSQLHRNPLGARTLLDLKVSRTPVVTVTGNHRVLALCCPNGKAEWVSVDKLTTNHYIKIPKRGASTCSAGPWIVDVEKIFASVAQSLEESTGAPWFQWKVKKDGRLHAATVRNLERQFGYQQVAFKKDHNNPLNAEWSIGPDEAMAIGMWFGDGSITHARSGRPGRPRRPRNVTLACHEKNADLHAFWSETMQRMTGLVPTIHKDKHGMVNVIFNSTVLAEVFHSLFRSGFANKRLHPEMFEWPEELAKAFVIGLVSTDGCLSKQGSMTVDLSNHALLTDVFQLLRSFGLEASLHLKGIQKGGTRPHGTLFLPQGWIQPDQLFKTYDDDRLSKRKRRSYDERHIRVAIHQGDSTFLRVKSITPSSHERSEFVYTLGVEDDHSYAVQGLLVENCFLLNMKEDSIDGIYDTLKQCALVSKSAGGVGVAVHKIRASHSYIRGTNGSSNGLVPMLRVYNDTARYVDQGARPLWSTLQA